MAAVLVHEPSHPNQWTMLLCGSHRDRDLSILLYNDKYESFIKMRSFQYYYYNDMLSKYINNKQAHFHHYQQQLTLSCPQEEIVIDQLPPQYRNVKSLTLTHCRMRTLEGIEQFGELQELKIKFNKIGEVSQLYRIRNKQLIHCLQFTGNDIEYFGQALFINLVGVFPNLIELNGKNYFSIVHKNINKHIQMKKIVAHSHRLQKQMLATIRKADLQTKEHRRYTDSRLQNTRSNCPTQRDEDMRQLKGDQSKQIQYTSKKQKSMVYSQRSDTQQKQNLNSINKQKEYDVSLGDISNIPMTKSIRGSYMNLANSQVKQNKKKGLQIFTLNQSLQGNKLPLSQPTATFAMQKQRENGGEIHSNLMFKNREKHKYKNIDEPIEQYAYESKQEYERPTKRETYQSVSDDPNQSWDSSLIEENIIREQKIQNEMRRTQFAFALFRKSLLYKTFYFWKNRPGEKNFPMKRQFL